MAVNRLRNHARVGALKTDSASKRAGRAGVVLLVSALVVALAYRGGGTNWAAGVATAVAIGLWLRSARRSYQEREAEGGPRLIVDRGGELADEERPRLSF